MQLGIREGAEGSLARRLAWLTALRLLVLTVVLIFTSAVYPDCPAITATDAAGDKCNADRDAALASSNSRYSCPARIGARPEPSGTPFRRTSKWSSDQLPSP